MSSKEERNIQAVRRGIEMLSNHDFDGYFAGFADDFTLSGTGVPRPLVGIDAARQNLAEFVKMFPDLRFTIRRIYASGDAVAMRFIARGTRTDGFLGLPPTDRPFEFSGATINEFRDGRRISTWQVWNNAYILQQIAPDLLPRAEQTFDVLDRPARRRELAYVPTEEVIVARGVENVSVFQQGAQMYMVADGHMFHLDGRPMGDYKGVFEPRTPVTPEVMKALSVRPSMPPGPIDQPGPVAQVPMLGDFKLTLSFVGGGSITIAGSARAHLITLADGSGLFMATVLALVTGGTGRYDGASGVECNTGSVHLTEAASFAPGGSFQYQMFYVFRVTTRRSVQDPPAAAAAPAPASVEPPRRPPAPETAGGPATQQDVRASLRLFQKLNRKDLDGIVEGVAPDFVAASDTLPKAVIHGPEEFEAALAAYVRMFPDIHLTTDQILAGEDLVGMRFTASGTRTRGFLGLPPTDVPFSYEGFTLNRFRAGERTRNWNFWDQVGVLQQIGALPASLAGETPRTGAPSPEGFQKPLSVPAEALLVGSGIETARVHEKDGEVYIVARGRTFDLAGRPTGSYTGTLRLAALPSPRELGRPPMPSVPIDRPGGIPNVPQIGELKVRFRHDGEGTVTVVGTGAAQLIPLADGSSLFMVTATGVISGGTGRYAGASGVECECGAAILPAGTELGPGVALDFKTFFAQRFVPASAQAATGRAGAAAAVPAPASSAARLAPPGIPRGADPATYQLKKVRYLLDRIANFSFFSMPDKRDPNVPLMHDGRLIGVEVHEDLHRFEMHPVQPITRRGLRANNRVGQLAARVHMTWRPCPDDFVATPGKEIPPTPLDPTRPQRFVMHDGHFQFDDDSGSGFRGFGSGRTFPVLVAGKPQLRIGAAVDVLEGLGELAGMAGILAINGYITPPDGLALNIMLRIMDPDGELLAHDDPPPLRQIRDPDPGTTFLVFRGEPNPADPVSLRAAPDGRVLGATGGEILRLVQIAFDVHGRHGIRSRTRKGVIAGKMTTRAIDFSPYGDPPFAFLTRGGVFSFVDRAGRSIGSVEANIVEGRALPTEVPGAPTPIYRVAGLAPFIRGTGQFKDVVGMVSVNTWISLAPTLSAGLYVFRISDPDGRFAAAARKVWG